MATTPRLFSPRGTGAAAGASASPAGHKKRNLSSESSPWSVEVVSVVPEQVRQNVQSAVAGAVHGKWACAVLSTGKVQVWNIKTMNLSESLQPTQEMASIFLPELTGNSYGQAKPLVCLTSKGGGGTGGSNNSTSSQNSVNLWVLHPSSGWLIMKTIFRKDLSASTRHIQKASGPSARTRLVDNPALTADGDGDVLDDDETFQYLSCRDSTVVVGTSKGKMFWVTYTAVPPALHLQRIEAPALGILNRLFGSDRSTADAIEASAGQPCHILPLSPSNNNGKSSAPTSSTLSPKTSAAQSICPQFLSVSTHVVVKWSVEQRIVNSGHHATFHPLVKADLASSFRNLTKGHWTVKEILNSTLSFDESSIHCIVRAAASASDPNDHGGKDNNEDDESRLYWVVVELDGDGRDEGSKSVISNFHWLDRFASADQVEISGMVSCANSVVYGGVSDRGSNTVILFAMIPGVDGLVEEVMSKREIPSLVPGTLGRDVVTHGCYLVASTGIGVRARYMELSSQNKRPRVGGQEAVSQSRIKTLASHLTSFFWNAYGHPTEEQTMPPSLRHADASDLEQVLVTVAIDLQKKQQGDAFLTASMAIQWHAFFVDLIQQGGLYRSLSDDGKWKMFGIGQEITVFEDVARLLKNESSEVAQTWCSRLKPHRVADWLLNIQSEVLQSNSLSEELWHKVLATASESILGIREELADARYDVSSASPREKLWTSQPPMIRVLSLQMDIWKKKQKSGGVIARPYVEAVVKVALLSCSEAYDEKPEPTDVDRLEQMKIVAIQVLRNASDGDDQLAFDLCVQHSHFWGICEISVQNEKTNQGTDLSIDPIFTTISSTDLKTGYTFPEYVLKWHADHDLLGHVINYGRHAPEDLKRIMNQENKLKRHQWIPAIRQGFFGNARDMFLEQSKMDNGLKSFEWSLSMARLANRLVVNQSGPTVQEIEHKIANDLKLVDAQKTLLGANTFKTGDDSGEMKSPEKLFELAFQKLENSVTVDERVLSALVALDLLSYMSTGLEKINNNSDEIMSLSRVWAELFLLDMARWSGWAYDIYDIAAIREEALTETVFGKVLQECRCNKDLISVAYGRHIEGAVLSRVLLDDEDREPYERLLRAVAAPSENLRAESLMVSSF